MIFPIENFCDFITEVHFLFGKIYSEINIFEKIMKAERGV